jgi:benzoylsuccinyl-CoA thiolase BbsB subunit
MVRFGRYQDRLVEEFASEAAKAALDDSGLGHRQIGMAVVGHSAQGRVAGQRILKELAMTGIPIINVENACAGGGTALHVAWMAVAAGIYETALVIGMEKMERGLIAGNPAEYESTLGKTLPAKYALRAKRHMREYGTTATQLAMVSVKNHQAGALNQHAHYQKTFTLDEVLASRPVAEPLTLLQCCPTTDGAAAVVVASEAVARQRQQKLVRVAASVLASGAYRNSKKDGITSDDDITTRTAASAYEMAGLGPADVNVAEVHDAFTIGEVLAYENLGLCARGEGGRLVERGDTALGGRIPVNPSGGLLSRGHPLGATGVAQIAELTWQLQGRCGARQVEGAKVALAQVVGGSMPGIGSGACAIHILTA